MNASCGHLHEACPAGHSLEGIIACDVHPWGAYVIDAIYSAAIVEKCSSCSEVQIQAANANLLDVIQRPIFFEELLDGCRISTIVYHPISQESVPLDWERSVPALTSMKYFP